MKPTGDPLATMLKTQFEPGSNLRGRLSFADGRYLLPGLRNGRTLHLGLPGGLDPERFVQRLEPDARVVLFTTDANLAAASVEAVRRRERAPLLETVVLPGWERLPVSDGSVSLVTTGTGRGSPPVWSYPRLAAELARIVQDGGAVTLETRGWIDTLRARELGRHLNDESFATDPGLWLLSISGSLRIAVEEGDLGAARTLLTWLGRGTSRRRRVFRVGIALLDRMGLLGLVLTRNRLVYHRKDEAASPADPSAGTDRHDGDRPEAARTALRNGGGRGERPRLWPPPYLRSVLEEAGVDVSRYRCAFHVHGRYDSNKVAFVLFDRSDGGEPHHLVKATRAPSFNYRLENENRCLSLLERRDYLPPSAYPRRTVLAYRSGLALLGMRFVSGRPLRDVSSAEPGCPHVRKVVRHLETLTTASAGRDPARASILGDALERLHRRFAEIYPMPESEAEFLARRVRELQELAPSVPTVFQHGDAGMWNIMVRGNEPVFLDWEVGEPSGMPLWDLFYFLRSVGGWSSRLAGNEDLVLSYEEHFLRPSPLAEFQDRVVERCRRRLQLDEDAVDPLFYTCWMHRALREAMQMERNAVERGIYYRLLRRSIQLRGLERKEGIT